MKRIFVNIEKTFFHKNRMHQEGISVLKIGNIVPEKQIPVVSSSAELQVLNEGAHAGKNIFAAMAMARRPEHEDLRPMS